MSLLKTLGVHKIPLVRRLHKAWSERDVGKREAVVTCHGYRMQVRDPRVSVIARQLLETGVWEREATEFIAARLRPGMAALDIGADVGYYTLLFSRHVGPTGRVYAFEPIAAAKALLDCNVVLNGLDFVKTYGLALFDRPGKVCLEGPFTKSRLNPSKARPQDNDLEVDMVVFDDWRGGAGVGRIDLVKLDVEGAELNILKGMSRTLRDEHPAILVEVHPEFIQTFGHTADDVLAFLRDLGYQMEPVGAPAVAFDRRNIMLYCQ